MRRFGDFFRRAIALRRAHAALRGGSFRVLRAESGERLLIYAREGGGGAAHGRHQRRVGKRPAAGSARERPLSEGLEGAALAAHSFAIHAGEARGANVV